MANATEPGQTTSSDGTVTFTNLTPGKTYFVYEFNQIPGFEQYDKAYIGSVTIEAGNNNCKLVPPASANLRKGIEINVTELSGNAYKNVVYNTMVGKVTIKKIYKEGDKDIAVNGITLALTRRRKCIHRDRWKREKR